MSFLFEKYYKAEFVCRKIWLIRFDKRDRKKADAPRQPFSGKRKIWVEKCLPRMEDPYK